MPTPLTTALTGVVVFAFGGTLVLLSVLVVLSNPSSFDAVGDFEIVFLGTLMAGFGLYLMIKAALAGRTVVAGTL
jgi:hypothetical protein